MYERVCVCGHRQACQFDQIRYERFSFIFVFILLFHSIVILGSGRVSDSACAMKLYDSWVTWPRNGSNWMEFTGNVSNDMNESNSSLKENVVLRTVWVPLDTYGISLSHAAVHWIHHFGWCGERFKGKMIENWDVMWWESHLIKALTFNYTLCVCVCVCLWTRLAWQPQIRITFARCWSRFVLSYCCQCCQLFHTPQVNWAELHASQTRVTHPCVPLRVCINSYDAKLCTNSK